MPHLNKESRVTGWTGQVRRMLLASVGVAFLAKDEVTDLVDRLVAKGEDAERDGRKLVSGLLTQPGKGLAESGRRALEQLTKSTRGIKKNVTGSLATAQGVTRGLAKNVQTRINRGIAKTLHSLHLVSATDVADINGKMDQLGRKLDRLGKK